MANVALSNRVKAVFTQIHQNFELADIFPDADPMLHQAYGFMRLVHSRQNRKGSHNRPYWHHPLMVFALVRLACGSLTDQLVALLHDCAEDMEKSWPGASRADVLHAIETQFGAEVARRVGLLSNPADLEKADKKSWQMAQLASYPEIMPVKLADKIANGYDTLFDPPLSWSQAECARQNQTRVEMVEQHSACLPELFYQVHTWLRSHEAH